MDVGRYVVEEHLRTGASVSQLAKAHGLHRSWVYKLLARYRRYGEPGLVPRSRRPKTSPARIAHLYEEQVLALRKDLCDRGLDAGAQTIYAHLARELASPPSVATIWRVLRARGFVVPEPHKRPRSSYRSFVAELPNECWQADTTHWRLADGTDLEVLNIIDDHSRSCVCSRAFVSTRAPDVVRALHAAAATWGFPERFLSDNGAIFTAERRGGTGAMEAELLALGIAISHSRPYHPQTCGKVERFHQTLKKYLAKAGPFETKRQLQDALDRFVAYYNTTRPHRALGRKTPLEAFSARVKAHPTGPKIDVAGHRVRRDKVDKSGTVTLRHKGELLHIGIGRAFAGKRVIMLVAGKKVQVLGTDGSVLRRLTLDPSRNYQRMP